MSSLRTGPLPWLVALLALGAVGCSFDSGHLEDTRGAAGSSASGGGRPNDPSAGIDGHDGHDAGRPNPGLADAGTTEDAGPGPTTPPPDAGDSGTSPPEDAGSGPNLCGNGRLDGAEICDPELDACCKLSCDGPIAAGRVCREADGKCDLPEACNGHDVDCPKDRFEDEGELCRSAKGDCDEPERCDGDHADCPSDELLAEGTECREAAGDCDVPESCDGDDVDCPSDELVADGTECRESEGDCDEPESCDGDDADCPSDELLPLGTVCRSSTTVCDAEETCDNVSPDCPSDALAASTVPCRPSVGACDDAELCTGSSLVCPPDLPAHCAVSVLAGSLPLHVMGSTAGTCATYVPSCASTGTNSNERMYLYTAPAAGSYRFDTFGSAYDTVLAIRDDSVCPITELACSDDVPQTNRASMVDVVLTLGQRVRVMVDGYQGAAGDFELTVRLTSDFDDWTCNASRFDRDDGCDCGCGVVDPDCDDESSDSCDRCLGCMDMTLPCAGSAKVEAEDNSQCTGWLCASEYYGTGDGCDCGCGIVDPDCVNDGPQYCIFCAACGDSHVPCANSARVADDDNTQCSATWTCNVQFYGTGDGCDCGCGIVDPDCEGITSGACTFCTACGDSDDPCSGSDAVNPNNNTRCAPAPAVWTCDPDWYNEPGNMPSCDCGCGIVDPDCASADASECTFCDACRDNDASPCADSPNVDPDDNTRCL